VERMQGSVTLMMSIDVRSVLWFPTMAENLSDLPSLQYLRGNMIFQGQRRIISCELTDANVRNKKLMNDDVGHDVVKTGYP